MRSFDNCGRVNSIQHIHRPHIVHSTSHTYTTHINVYRSCFRQFLRLTIYVTVAQMVCTKTSPCSKKRSEHREKPPLLFGMLAYMFLLSFGTSSYNSCYQNQQPKKAETYVNREKKLQKRSYFYGKRAAACFSAA